MRRLTHYIDLEKAYLRLGFYTFTEYPLDSVLWAVSMLAREATGFIGVILIAKTLGGLGGWNFYAVCILFAMAMIPDALGQSFMDSVWNIGGTYIRKGGFDTLMVRPAPILMQLLGQRFNMQALVTFTTAILILVYGWIHAGIALTVGNILFVLECIIFGTLLNTSVYLFFNSLNFWLVQGSDIANLVLTLRQFAKYPLHIFPQAIRFTMTFVIPFGFIGYYPAAWLLGKTDLNLPFILPAAALITAAAAGVIWRFGIKGYNSTGT